MRKPKMPGWSKDRGGIWQHDDLRPVKPEPDVERCTFAVKVKGFARD